MAHPSCSNLSQRGFTVFCMNTRYDDNETLVNFDLLAQDVAVAVNYLKKRPAMKYVILLGHSGGGPTTTNYQAIAVNGPSWCQGENKLTQCASSGSGSVAGLTPPTASCSSTPIRPLVSICCEGSIQASQRARIPILLVLTAPIRRSLGTTACLCITPPMGLIPPLTVYPLTRRPSRRNIPLRKRSG